MAKRVVWLSQRGESFVKESGAAGEAITPGQLVMGETTILKQTAAGEDVPRRIALEREEMGQDIDTAYVLGDQVKVGHFGPGDVVNGLIASGQNIAANGYVEAAADGTFKAHAAGTRLGRALEASGAVLVLTRLRIEIMMFILATVGALFAVMNGHVTDGGMLIASVVGPASIVAAKDFLGSGGRWAAERFMEALQAGRDLNAEVLRTNATLLKDEWVQYDTAIVQGGTMRLRFIADLISQGLTQPINGGLGTTIFQYQKVNDMDDAIVSMTGKVRSENSRLDFGADGVPLPIIHKDFNIDLRQLLASRKGQMALDTLSAQVSGRKCGEKLEEMAFLGGPQFLGLPIYGVLTHPSRNQTSFGAGGAWSGSKTGDEILKDVQAWIAIAVADRFPGPFVLYVGSSASLFLANDFKAQSSVSTRTRLLELDELSDIRVSDKMPAAQAVLVQMTSDVITLLQGEPLQTVQWDLNGGFEIAFKAFMQSIPLVRADSEGRSGIVHAS